MEQNRALLRETADPKLLRAALQEMEHARSQNQGAYVTEASEADHSSLWAD